MSDHDGHRRRIIEKLDQGGLCQHEYLEILLFNAVPRRNTNDLAHRLLATFGTIPGVFSASLEQLKAVDGVGESVAAYLCCIGRFYKSFYASGERSFPEKFVPADFPVYIREKYAGIGKEVLDFYLFDESRTISCRRRFTTGNERRVVVKPDELTRLLDLHKPYGAVAVHNHLEGGCLPSEADDRATYQFQVICSIQNVRLCDHFIYSPEGVYSYYSDGRMREISRRFSITSLVGGQGENADV